jgi:hypothetical protein
MARRRLSDAEKDARRRADRERLEHAARELLTSDGWKRWLRVRATNGLARYSLRNQWLIALECHRRAVTPTHIAGFRAFLALNRCVRNGERAIRILAPVAVTERDEHGEETGAKRILFRSVPVFDTLCRVRWWGRTVCECRSLRGGSEERCRCGGAVARVRSRVAATSPCRGARVVRDGGSRGPVRSGSGRWFVGGAFVELLCVLWGVVDEGGGEVAVGVFLGELARVGEHDRDRGVADLQARDEL